MVTVTRPRPRVLHLFSDWKWTGPAEPTVNLCRHLRRHGYVVDFACAQPRGKSQSMLEKYAQERHVEPITDFQLNKRPNLLANMNDIRALTQYIDQEEVEIIHVHSSHDHYIGSRAARKANNLPFVVRTNHLGEPLPTGLRYRWVIRGHTDGWLALSQSCLDADIRNFGLDPRHGVVVEGIIDTERFNPNLTHRDTRNEFGFSPEHVVCGVVARVQKHRRFDVLLPALADAMKQEPRLRALIIGRGSNIRQLAHEPVEELGIADKAVFAGYRKDDYVDCLASIDFLTFLVPGSDGSCRAAREAMALGKPLIVSERGILPGLVEDGRCGLAVHDTRENLTRAILRMARDTELRKICGQAAAAKAAAKFNIEQQVEAIAELYMRLAEGR